MPKIISAIDSGQKRVLGLLVSKIEPGTQAILLVAVEIFPMSSIAIVERRQKGKARGQNGMHATVRGFIWQYNFGSRCGGGLLCVLIDKYVHYNLGVK